MDKEGIDVHVLIPLPWIDGVEEISKVDELALEACRVCNEEVSINH